MRKFLTFDHQRQSRPPIRFSLGSLIVMVALAAVALAFVGYKYRRYAQESRAKAEAFDAIDHKYRAMGGSVEVYGNEMGREVIGIRLSNTDARDEDLEDITRLPNVETLELDNTLITDNGLAKLKGLGQLRVLFLGNKLDHFGQLAGPERSKITDEGMVHLAAIKSLEDLGLDGTEVTDEGVTRLRGLDNLKYIHLEHAHVSEHGAAGLFKVLPHLQLVYRNGIHGP